MRQIFTAKKRAPMTTVTSAAVTSRRLSQCDHRELCLKLYLLETWALPAQCISASSQRIKMVNRIDVNDRKMTLRAGAQLALEFSLIAASLED